MRDTKYCVSTGNSIYISLQKGNNNWILISANSFGQSGQNNDGLVCWEEALEVLQKGWLVRGDSRAKDPGLCCSVRCAVWPCA